MRRLLSVALALLAAAPVAAQTVGRTLPTIADSASVDDWAFGVSIGGGPASFQFHCPSVAGIRLDCYDERNTGGSAYARVGLFPRRFLFTGLEVVGWRTGVQGVDYTALYVSLVAQLYPLPGAGLYLRGGAGAALTWVSDDADEATTDGTAWSVGLGYDVPVMQHVALTPFVTYLRSFEAEIQLNHVPTERVISHHLLQFGLGLAWR
ncbi:MAG TPA: hypothetical protein VFS08_11015 [Gemmatimonadaceae bacterium]|nr:hypothetical protein [Gemmatimonadaceae bacterium]